MRLSASASWVLILAVAGLACAEPSDDGADDSDAVCWDAPDNCLQYLLCVGAIAPGELAAAEAMYGERGSCWCDSTDDEAQACYATCVHGLTDATAEHPTANECQASYCGVDELDPEQPYGPVVDGQCPDYNDAPQQPLVQPLGLDGSVCAPKCSGIAKYCPEHPQTSAAASCFLSVGESSYCVNYCWVDSTVIGGTQCQCGAHCQPYGSPDGDGNMRGICTFE